MIFLDRYQRAAAEADDGPNLVLAGPGTGKTTTFIGRYLVLRGRGRSPRQVLGVTFTAKAAEELKRRVSDASGDTERPVFGTFHSIARRLLSEFGHLTPLGADFRILDEPAQRALMAEAGIWWDADNGGDFLEIVGGAKDRLLSPAEYREEAADLAKKGSIPRDDWRFDAAEKYAEYQAALEAKGACDFGDLICKAVRLLRERADVRREVSGRFSDVLVDEFQDVNPAQVAFLDCLLEGNRNIWAVGDDDQTLYAFRSADVGFILGFRDKWPGCAVHKLGVNYRSPPRVLAPALALIGMNGRRFEKPLESAYRKGPKPVVVQCANADAEAAWIVDSVRRLLASGWRADQVAVLFRVGHISAKVQMEMSRKGVPFTLRGVQGFWDSPEAKAVVGFARVASGLDNPDSVNMLGYGKRAERFLKKARSFSGSPFAEVARAAADVVGSAKMPNRSEERREEWCRNAAVAGDVALECGGLDEFLEAVEAQRESARKGGDAVVLGTVHGAKGLEWPAVFVAGFEREILPHKSSEDREEERRIGYVAMTRSRRFLAVTYCSERGGESAGVSPFLDEAFGNLGSEYEWRGPEGDAPVPPGRRRVPDLNPKEGGARQKEGKRVLVTRSGSGDEGRKRRPASRVDEPWTDKEVARALKIYGPSAGVASVAETLRRDPRDVAKTLARALDVEVPNGFDPEGALVVDAFKRGNLGRPASERVADAERELAAMGWGDAARARFLGGEHPGLDGSSPAAELARRPGTVQAVLRLARDESGT